MKIWLNTLPLSQPTMDDCDDDCTPPDGWGLYGSLAPINFSLAEDILQYVRTNALQCTFPLHQQACDAERWLVCNPTGGGVVAVLDQQAQMLLKKFRVLKSLPTVMQELAEWPARSIEKCTALLYQLGFLEGQQRPSFVHEWNEPAALSAWLHVTNACNLRCPYCYLHKNAEHMANDISRQAVDAIFRSATRNHFQRVQLKYAGGEATLHMSHVLAIHDYASQLAREHGIDLYAYIISNGVSLSQRGIDGLKQRNIGVTISLDGIGAYHDAQRVFINGQGSFKYVDCTIDRLLASGLVPHINVTVSQRNLNGLPALMDYILTRNMSFTLSYYRDNECSSHIRDLQYVNAQMITGMRAAFEVIERHLPRRCLLESLIDKAKMHGAHRHTCGVGQNYLVIDQHGAIAKCHADIRYTVTNIRVDDPLEAIRNDRAGIQGFSVEDKEGCRTCEWRYWCAGGCPLLTYRVTGRSDVKSPNCNIYKALFPDVLRLEALRLLKYESPLIL